MYLCPYTKRDSGRLKYIRKGGRNLKVSHIKHIIIVSMIYNLIIIGLVWYYSSYAANIEKADLVSVVATARDISQGTVIGQEDVVLHKIYSADVHPQAVKDLKDVLGKRAVDRFLAGETVLSSKILPEDKWFNDLSRLYAVRVDADSTGGYDVKRYEDIDICVEYSTPSADYKLVDVVLAKRKVMDIRNESGTSIQYDSTIKPGFLVFQLTYEEINLVKQAQKQGKLFIGKYGSPMQPKAPETYPKAQQSN